MVTIHIEQTGCCGFKNGASTLFMRRFLSKQARAIKNLSGIIGKLCLFAFVCLIPKEPTRSQFYELQIYSILLTTWILIYYLVLQLPSRYQYVPTHSELIHICIFATWLDNHVQHMHVLTCWARFNIICFIMMRSVLRMEAIDSQAILTPLAMRVQFSITA